MGTRGGRGKKNEEMEKQIPTYVRTYFIRRTTSWFFFYFMFEFSLSRNALKRNWKKKTTRGSNLDARPCEAFEIAFSSCPYREALNQSNKRKNKKDVKNPPGKTIPRTQICPR
jgi:hypothetical protein